MRVTMFILCLNWKDVSGRGAAFTLVYDNNTDKMEEVVN